MLYWMQKFVKISLKFHKILQKFDKDPNDSVARRPDLSTLVDARWRGPRGRSEWPATPPVRPGPCTAW